MASCPALDGSMRFGMTRCSIKRIATPSFICSLPRAKDHFFTLFFCVTRKGG
jgi:hypothetical protein